MQAAVANCTSRELDTQLPLFRTIVVGTDGSDTAQEAVRHAVAVSRAHGARLHLVSAAPGMSARRLEADARDVPDEIRYQFNPRQAVSDLLDDIADRIRPFGIEVSCHPEIDVSPAAAILAVAASVEADLIVVGNRGMHGIHRVLGSVPNAVSHNAPCSVAIIRTT